MPQLILITCGETHTECPVSVYKGYKDRESETDRDVHWMERQSTSVQHECGCMYSARLLLSLLTQSRYIPKTIWSAMCCCILMCFWGLGGVLVVRKITLGYNSDKTKKEIQHIIFKNSISLSKEANPVIYQPILLLHYIILSFINC